MNKTTTTLLKLLGLALLAFGVIGHVEPVEARLDPFYIVTGSSYASSSPRILFLLDSSGSMAHTLEHYPNSSPKNKRCLWHQCEDANAGIKQSRGWTWIEPEALLDGPCELLHREHGDPFRVVIAARGNTHASLGLGAQIGNNVTEHV